jgi:heptosyltransferase-2
MKILIIRFSSIGDIVLTTPVIRCLKEQLPQVEIHYCSKSNFKAILDPNPYISKNYYYQNNLSSLLEELKNEKYDLIIDLHHNLRTLIMKLKLGIESRSFRKMNFQKWLLVKWKINKMGNSHVVDRYMETIAHLGIVNDNKGLDYFIPTPDVVNLNALPGQFNHGYTAYAIGGQHATKKLPLHKMIELCKQIQQPIILLGGKEDFNNADQIISACTDQMLYNACGQYNLNQSASLIAQATNVISHDTGLMHIAAAFKKNIISIWGNTVPALGFSPYQTSFKVVENNAINCRPCSKLGYSACPKSHFKCMEELDFSNILH